MSKIILHIGSHKTGTTSLQHCFHDNADVLASHGVIYPQIHSNRAHHILAAVWQEQVTGRTGILPKDALETWGKIRDAYADGDKTVFLSGENFSRVYPERVDFKHLARLVRGFDEVEIIYVMREQATLCQSIYMQVTKDSAVPPPFDNIMERAFSDLTPTGVTLNHLQVLEMILEGFDLDQVTIAEYGALRARPNGVIGFMLECAGLSGVPEGFSFENSQQNVSQDPLSQWVALDMMPGQKLDPALVKCVRETIEEVHGAGVRTSLLTRAEVKSFKQIFDPLNRKLMRRMIERPQHLKLPLVHIPKNTLMRNQLGLEFWRRLAYRLARQGIQPPSPE